MDAIRNLSLLLLRCALGVIFLYHGATKALHWHQTLVMFPKMGFAVGFAYVAVALELGGGALLILGLLARWAGLLLAGEMLIALLRVHLPAGPILAVSRYELPMILSAASFAIFAFGAGSVALGRPRRGARARGAARG